MKISKLEAEKWHEAFEKPEFQNLLSDYIAEMNDPAFREAQNQYLRYLENQHDLPKGKALLHPTSGFVLKFQQRKISTSIPLNQVDDESLFDDSSAFSSFFVNIVHSNQITPPHKGDTNQWLIPHMSGPLRMEPKYPKVLSKESQPSIMDSLVPTFDCCFHSQTLILCAQCSQFRNMIAEIVREQALMFSRAREPTQDNKIVVISNKYRVLKGVQYKGGSKPLPLMYDMKSLDEVIKNEDMNVDRALPESLPEPCDSSIQTVSSTQIGFHDETIGHVDGNLVIPKYDMKLQTDLELAAISTDFPSRAQQCERVVITIQLPEVLSCQQIDLNIDDDVLTLRAESKTLYNIMRYHLVLEIPYKNTCSCRATAQFNKDECNLMVKIPLDKPFIS